MSKRAAIYIRVSSEAQAEKVSPQAQEADCRDLCQRQGYQVVEVYRDTEKYKVGGRMVEPSGTRADRPQLKRILADARAGKIDVIIAWREDRLYRSYRPMLDVLDCLDETGIDIELAKETFDKRIAPVKAWAARMELDAKHDRLMMGGRGRMESGKPWMSCPPYGYQRVDGEIVIDETEAQWVRNIYKWYAEGATGRQIRQRLITSGAPQRNKDVTYPWALSNMYALLRNEYYYTGIALMHWGGETFQTFLPTIIDPETAERVSQRRAKYKRYPSGNLKAKALAPGKVHCARCNTRMQVISSRQKGHTYLYYRCSTVLNMGDQPEGCAGSRRISLIDADIWQKLWTLISKPGELEAALEQRIATLQAEETDAQADCEKIERELEMLAFEREKVITWARKKIITEGDLKVQMLALTSQETELLRDLSDRRLLVGNRAEQLLQMAAFFRERVNLAREAINSDPRTPQEAEAQFQARRKIIDGLVTRVDVYADKSTKVHLEWDPLEMTNLPMQAGCQDDLDGGDNLRIRYYAPHC